MWWPIIAEKKVGLVCPSLILLNVFRVIDVVDTINLLFAVDCQVIPESSEPPLSSHNDLYQAFMWTRFPNTASIVNTLASTMLQRTRTHSQDGPAILEAKNPVHEETHGKSSLKTFPGNPALEKCTSKFKDLPENDWNERTKLNLHNIRLLYFMLSLLLLLKYMNNHITAIIIILLLSLT